MSAALSVRSGLPVAPQLATIQVVVPDPMTDGELIARVGEGDSGAFELLYRRYARPVFALALRRLGDRGRAEDAVQETFASVWRSARSYRQERGPGAPWLYAVARNAIVDRRRALGEPPAEPVDEAAKDPGPPERAESSWTAWRVHRALGELPEQRAPAHRARVLGRALPERDRAVPRRSARNGQDADAQRARAPRRRPGRRALVTGPPEFRDLVGDDLSAEERARLERVHDMLVEAGPPPELPPSLAEAPATRRAASLLAAAPPPRRRAGPRRGDRCRGLPRRIRRRLQPQRLRADARGFDAGHRRRARRARRRSSSEPPTTAATGRCSSRCSGLPRLSRGAVYYQLFLTRNGKPIAPCGGFNVKAGTTTVEVLRPLYAQALRRLGRDPPRSGEEGPGPALLTTT